MKTESRNYRKLAIVALAFTLAFSAPAVANDGDKKGLTTELKFVGSMENQPIFQLNMINIQEDEITVTFRDENGNILYSDKYKGASLSKKFLLQSDDQSDATVSIVVESKKMNSTEVYSINRNDSYGEKAVINKVN